MRGHLHIALEHRPSRTLLGPSVEIERRPRARYRNDEEAGYDSRSSMEPNYAFSITAGLPGAEPDHNTQSAKNDNASAKDCEDDFTRHTEDQPLVDRRGQPNPESDRAPQRSLRRRGQKLHQCRLRLGTCELRQGTDAASRRR